MRGGVDLGLVALVASSRASSWRTSTFPISRASASKVSMSSFTRAYSPFSAWPRSGRPRVGGPPPPPRARPGALSRRRSSVIMAYTHPFPERARSSVKSRIAQRTVAHLVLLAGPARQGSLRTSWPTSSFTTVCCLVRVGADCVRVDVVPAAEVAGHPGRFLAAPSPRPAPAGPRPARPWGLVLGRVGLHVEHGRGGAAAGLLHHLEVHE